MHYAIERSNYERDPRVNPRQPTVEITILNDDDTETVIELPTVWAICHVCDGNGRHVNPSIDAGGLSSDDFLEDPDFFDDYMSGAYDVTCSCCHGSGKVRVPDLERLTPEQREALEEQERADAEYDAMCRAERAMGA